MAASAQDLFDLAQEFLTACEEAVAKESPGGAIGYSAISTGEPAYDCVPALYVHVGGSAQADTLPLSPTMQPMHRMNQQGLVNLITMTCTVLRCVPVTEQQGQDVLVPDPALITAAARESYGDLWAIWNYLKTKYRAKELFTSFASDREFIFDPAVPIRTSGGAGGWAIQVRVQLGGYTTST